MTDAPEPDKYTIVPGKVRNSAAGEVVFEGAQNPNMEALKKKLAAMAPEEFERDADEHLKNYQSTANELRRAQMDALIEVKDSEAELRRLTASGHITGTKARIDSAIDQLKAQIDNPPETLEHVQAHVPGSKPIEPPKYPATPKFDLDGKLTFREEECTLLKAEYAKVDETGKALDKRKEEFRNHADPAIKAEFETIEKLADIGVKEERMHTFLSKHAAAEQLAFDEARVARRQARQELFQIRSNVIEKLTPEALPRLPGVEGRDIVVLTEAHGDAAIELAEAIQKNQSRLETHLERMARAASAVAVPAAAAAAGSAAATPAAATATAAPAVPEAKITAGTPDIKDGKFIFTGQDRSKITAAEAKLADAKAKLTVKANTIEGYKADMGKLDTKYPKAEDAAKKAAEAEKILNKHTSGTPEGKAVKTATEEKSKAITEMHELELKATKDFKKEGVSEADIKKAREEHKKALKTEERIHSPTLFNTEFAVLREQGFVESLRQNFGGNAMKERTGEFALKGAGTLVGLGMTYDAVAHNKRLDDTTQQERERSATARIGEGTLGALLTAVSALHGRIR